MRYDRCYTPVEALSISHIATHPRDNPSQTKIQHITSVPAYIATSPEKSLKRIAPGNRFHTHVPPKLSTTSSSLKGFTPMPIPDEKLCSHQPKIFHQFLADMNYIFKFLILIGPSGGGVARRWYGGTVLPPTQKIKTVVVAVPVSVPDPGHTHVGNARSCCKGKGSSCGVRTAKGWYYWNEWVTFYVYYYELRLLMREADNHVCAYVAVCVPSPSQPSLLSIFSAEQPHKLTLFGDLVDSIRTLLC